MQKRVKISVDYQRQTENVQQPGMKIFMELTLNNGKRKNYNLIIIKTYKVYAVKKMN
jgi:hypothetical protein